MLAAGDATVAQASAGEELSVGRWTENEFACPNGTELRQVTSPDEAYRALWCEIVRGRQVARHGPYLEVFAADGSALRQGLYFKGLQTGLWTRWTRQGKIERQRLIWPGEASRFIPSPEDLCPPGTRRDRSTGFDHKRRMWSKCFRLDEAGKQVLEGPYVTWDEERLDGATRYKLRQIMGYKDGERHGRHQVFEGPFGAEVLVEDEVFHEGNPDGTSRAFYLDGTPREVREYSDHRLHGLRTGYDRQGHKRWWVTYERGRRVDAGGDLTVGGEPCPEETVPWPSADGLKEHCARRRYHFQEFHGSYQERYTDGTVAERGLYRWGRKVEVWDGEQLPVVSKDIQVAEGQLKWGETLFMALNEPPAVPDLWEDAKLSGSTAEQIEAQIAHLEAEQERAEAEIEASTTPFDIWFRNNASKKYPSPRTVVEDGRVKIFGLSPGSYYMRVEIDLNRDNPMQYAGDLTSSSSFDVVEGEVTQFEAPLFATLRLTEPWDTGQDLPGWSKPCGEGDTVPRTSRFVWQPADSEDPSGIEYEYRVRRYHCQPYRASTVVAEGTTYDNFVTLDLPPSDRDTTYAFTLLARRGGQVMGQLMTFGDNGHGWSLKFRVR